EHYDFTEHEREVFEVVGMKDYEYVIENLEVETSTPSLERLIEIAGEYEDEYKKLDESEQEKLSENFLKIMALADEDAEDLIASTYHAGMPITDAIDEADSMLTEIVELFPIYRKTEDQVVLMSHEVFNIFDEDGNPRVLKDVIKDADTAMISSESLTLYQQEILRFAGKTPAEIRDESQYAGLSITDAIEESEKLTAIFANVTGEQRENLKKYIGLEDESAVELAVESLLGIMGKSADTIAEELGVTVSLAYESVAKISKNPVTQTIRGIHRYGAYCFIAILMLRWLRMFFCGEFKKPGELTWIVLTIIIIVSTFSGVTGYLLPFDQRSYWATTVGTQMLNSLDDMPVIGPLGLGAALKYMGLGAHQVGQSTILRFNIIHYFLPLLMFLMAEIYFLRSRKRRPKINWTAIILLAVIIIAACLYLPAVNEPPPNIVK
ncbi:MAG: cytochrome b N-terminal domain-containing protein, partial [Caldisericia bacterium]|nr:cytochrome b N-terminal domain-containing protein [Caldisericia bacterium]